MDIPSRLAFRRDMPARIGLAPYRLDMLLLGTTHWTAAAVAASSSSVARTEPWGKRRNAADRATGTPVEAADSSTG